MSDNTHKADATADVNSEIQCTLQKWRLEEAGLWMTIHRGTPLYIWVTIHRGSQNYISCIDGQGKRNDDDELIMTIMIILVILMMWCCRAPEDIFIHLRHNLLTKFWIWGKTKQITSLYITTLKDYICPTYITSILVQVYYTCAHNMHSRIWVTTQRSTISSASVTKRAPAVASTRCVPGPSSKR